MDIYELIRKEYLTHGAEDVLAHVEEVAQIAVRLSGLHGLDREKARLAAMLHDISAVMTPDEMFDHAKTLGLELDPSEEKYHFMLHQRISAIMAREKFGVTDGEVLSAVECHTTLKKGSAALDKALFIADKLSSGRSGRPPYYGAVKKAAEESLDTACYICIKYQLDHGMLSMPHRWLIEAFSELSCGTATRSDGKEGVK